MLDLALMMIMLLMLMLLVEYGIYIAKLFFNRYLLFSQKTRFMSSVVLSAF